MWIPHGSVVYHLANTNHVPWVWLMCGVPHRISFPCWRGNVESYHLICFLLNTQIFKNVAQIRWDRSPINVHGIVCMTLPHTLSIERCVQRKSSSMKIKRQIFMIASNNSHRVYLWKYLMIIFIFFSRGSRVKLTLFPTKKTFGVYGLTSVKCTACCWNNTFGTYERSRVSSLACHPRTRDRVS